MCSLLCALASAQTTPTPEETAVLCWINRFRSDPQAFGRLVLAGPRPSNSGGVDWALFEAELRTLCPAPPLLYEPRLLEAARAHARYMPMAKEYGHRETHGAEGFTGEWPVDRARAAGYADPVEECSCARGATPFEIVASYVIDAAPPGRGSGGMQERRGHRAALIDARWNDVGVGLAPWGQGQWSNVVVCGTSSARGRVLGGVAFEDRDGDGAYGIGEGLPEVHLRVGDRSALASASGAWRLELLADNSARTLVARRAGSELVHSLDARAPREVLQLRFELATEVEALERKLRALPESATDAQRALRMRLIALRSPRTDAERALASEVTAQKSAVLQALGTSAADDVERQVQAGLRAFAGTDLVAWLEQARRVDRLARAAEAVRRAEESVARARSAQALARQIERTMAEVPSPDLWRRLESLQSGLRAL
ncbi:MAG: CAP domain-containing protein [Planctomycetes bacterium]|nr:CAP domain-containing protein [Planctomycetota bacterium]